MPGETHLPVHPGDKITAILIARIYDGMRARTLPKAEWTHGAHLIFGSAILDDLGLEAAEKSIPDMIRHYNVATGVENTDTDGYHHTITLFYLRVVSHFLESRASDDLAARAAALLASPLAAREYPLSFYTSAHLFSVAARQNWAQPDIKPLP